MVVLNYTGGEINAKIVYYGPGLSGKTTNLEFIHEKTPVGSRGKMVSMKTQTDRTLFFDFLPLELGEIGGYRTRFLLYTVPGQVYYNATRKLVLKGVDAVVFVADSSRAKLEENLESLRNLEQNLNEHGLTLDELPWVIQYNKRDAGDALSVRDLDARLNPLRVQTFEAVATKGVGVYETFHGIATQMYQVLKERLEQGELDTEAGATRPATQSISVTGAAPPKAPPPARPPGKAPAPRRPAAPPPPAEEAPEGELEFDSAIDSMLREVDAPPAKQPGGRAPASRAGARPAPPADPPADPPIPQPRRDGARSGNRDRDSHAPRGRGGGAPERAPTGPRVRDVSAPVNHDRAPMTPPAHGESSAADDSLFESVPGASFDLELGRLPALDEASLASDTVRDEGPHEFVTDPMRRPARTGAPAATPARPAAPAPAPARAPAAAPPARPAPATEPVSVTVPVLLTRAQVDAGVPVRIILDIQLIDE
jgi:signal recognition particle receptor subunit beta